MKRGITTLSWTLALALLTGAAAGAQNGVQIGERRPTEVVSDPRALPVPFGPGELATYQVKFGIISVGEGRLAVRGVDTVRGHPSYRLEMGFEGGLGPARVDDTYESWLDVRTLASRRFIRDVHELSYQSRREWAIFPEDKRWERLDTEVPQVGNTISELPLDELAFVYFLRTRPLKVGETYHFTRYFREDGNPVVVKVLRKEVKEVPAGTFNTIVVQPVIRTRGLFSEGGKAEIYLTDDEHRHVVYLRSEISSIGSLTLQLKELREGTPLNPKAGRSGASAPLAPGR